MTTIKAPYNFVPLNDKVFTPEWAPMVSHDIPFMDGLSGEIELEIEAESPLYVRNGHSRDAKEKDRESYDRFSEFQGRHFIPGTSVKGMLRNVMEIISFSKMPTDDRMRFAIRDMKAKKEDNIYPLKDITVQQNMRCGWLSKEKEGDGYMIQDSGLPYRISHKEIDKMLGKNLFESNFSRENGIDLTKPNGKFNPKMACYKYHLVGDTSIIERRKFRVEHGSRKVVLDSDGEIGTVVFTGQPDKWDFPRKKGSKGKFYEFVFLNNQSDTEYPISNELIRQYDFFMSDSDDWKYWLKILKRGGKCPIFFRIEKNQIKDFGLALLYRLPYEKSVKDIVEKEQKSSGIDLTECILGYTNIQDQSLKSRVQVGHAFATQDLVVLPRIEGTLGGPKASYYPTYIRQTGANGKVTKYNTYNDGVISGWKRYPLKPSEGKLPMLGESMDSTFIPVDKGSKFEGRITFHNLKPVELGCLLSAITFHNNPGFRHSIGLAKPYGYGNVKVTAKLRANEPTSEGVAEYISIFEEQMNKFLRTSWICTEQVRELFAMSDPSRVTTSTIQELNYLNLKSDNDENEFTKVKENREYLKPFSQLFKNGLKIDSPLGYYLARVKVREEEEEQRRIEAEKLAEYKRLKEKEAREAEERMLRMNQQREGGLEPFLSSKDFKAFANKTTQWKNKFGYIPKDQHEHILKALQQYKEKDRALMVDTKKGFGNGWSWRQVEVWVGKEMAQEWFDEFVKN